MYKDFSEESLRESLEFSQAVLSESPIGMAIYTSDGRCVSVNKTMSSIVGTKQAKLLGQNLQEVDAWKNYDLLNDATNTLSDGVLRKKEIFFLGNPQISWLECRCSRFQVQEQAYLLLLIDDISERKKEEEERISLERNIQHAKKLESLGVLAGGIAHDFNNLLVSVLGNAELALLDLEHESPVRAYIQSVQDASMRMKDLTKKMLAYSGKGKFIIKPFNLSELAKEMVEHLLTTAEKKILKLELDSNLPEIEGDPDQIRQVFLNLLSNASDACVNDSGTITVRTGVSTEDRTNLSDYFLFEALPDGNYVFLEVSDTGCGMDKDTCQRIFEPFFSTKFTGRGLGMAAVLGIIRGHGGAIKVCSEPDRGTIIRILFPLEDGKIREKVTESLSGDPIPTPEKGLILVVDEVETVLSTVESMLERSGYSVLTATDGLEAIQKVRNHAKKLVCVLLDFSMTKMNGIEAFSQIRQIRSDLPVILCSGYRQREVTSYFKGKELTGFLQKPFPYHDLAAKLQEVLKT